MLANAPGLDSWRRHMKSIPSWVRLPAQTNRNRQPLAIISVLPESSGRELFPTTGTPGSVARSDRKIHSFTRISMFVTKFQCDFSYRMGNRRPRRHHANTSTKEYQVSTRCFRYLWGSATSRRAPLLSTMLSGRDGGGAPPIAPSLARDRPSSRGDGSRSPGRS